MGARDTIDRLFEDHGDEYSFPYTLHQGDWDGVDVEVTYRGSRHSAEDRQITGQAGAVSIVDVTADGQSVLRQLPPEMIEHLTDHALEHYVDHMDDAYDRHADDEGD